MEQVANLLHRYFIGYNDFKSFELAFWSFEVFSY